MTIILDRDRAHAEPHIEGVPVETDRSHVQCDTHLDPAPVETLGGHHDRVDNQKPNVLPDLSGEGRAIPEATPTFVTPSLTGYAELRLLAESFEDAQKARIAIENRLRSGTDSGPVADALAALAHAEGKLSLALRRKLRKAAPEIALWAKDTVGIGEHLVARLVGTIGHPVIASPYHWEGEGSDRLLVPDPPFGRSVSQLWAYCGHGDPTRKRRKGMTADEAMAMGNPRAKMLVHLIAEGAMKCPGSATEPATPTELPPAPGTPENDGEATEDAPPASRPPLRRRSPYRDVYDLGRITYARREEWSALHRHNAALRLTGKAILRDLWLVARDSIEVAA